MRCSRTPTTRLARMLKAPWCVGIKIHPEEHAYRIADHGEELFSFFEETGAAVMTHSGCPNSLPEDFVPFADRHPGARVLLAHLGNGNGAGGRVDLQVRAIQAAKQGNLWVDTSSARSILPGLVEWAVRELGAEKVLFAAIRRSTTWRCTARASRRRSCRMQPSA
ncbi:MAG: amidohydrolase family protein [Lacunisphaera sp.]